MRELFIDAIKLNCQKYDCFPGKKCRSHSMFTPEFMAVAKYSYPYTEPLFDEKDFSNVEVHGLCKLVFRNKVSLSFYQNLLRSRSKQKNLLKLKMLIEKRWHDDRHIIFDAEEKIRDVDELFRANNVKYLTHKPFFFARAQGDIDIIVSKQDFDFAIELLKSKYVPVLRYPNEITMATWIRNRIVTIDVYNQVSFFMWNTPKFNRSLNTWDISSKAFELLPNDELWKRTVTMTLANKMKVPIPSAENCFLIIAAHTLYGDGEISLYDLFQLEGVLRRFSTVDWSKIVEIADTNWWGDFLFYFFATANYFSFALYRKTIVPEWVFSYAKDQSFILQKISNIFSIRKSASSMPYDLSAFQKNLCILRKIIKKDGPSVFPSFPKMIFNRFASLINQPPEFIFVGSYYVPWFYKGIISHLQPEKIMD